DDPGTDLAVAAAVASSFRNIEVDGKTVIIGEIGLGGEVRAVANLERRLKEAKKLGFKRAIVPKTNGQSFMSAGISAIPVENLAQALDILIGR
ncbi:MAG: DNA repair protein RadA, partial [Clostridia bacterium]|nr:DNA repair protein RadA [Clostridia bacterium]